MAKTITKDELLVKVCQTCAQTYTKLPRRSNLWFKSSKFCSSACVRHSTETREKMRVAHLGRKYKPMSEEGRQNLSRAHMGKTQTPETIEKRRRANAGFLHTEETKRQLSVLRTGKGNGMFGIRGAMNHNWKGGYENQLLLNRLRRARRKEALGEHTLAEWEALKARYNHMCLCCKRTEPDIKLAADHVVPLVRGGTHDIENIQPLCKPCNSRKYVKEIDFRIKLNCND